MHTGKEYCIHDSYDYAQLRGKIAEVYGTGGQKLFAESLGISPTSLYSKLNGSSKWTQSEMASACELLNVSTELIPALFFYKSSSKNVE